MIRQAAWLLGFVALRIFLNPHPKPLHQASAKTLMFCRMRPVREGLFCRVRIVFNFSSNVISLASLYKIRIFSIFFCEHFLYSPF